MGYFSNGTEGEMYYETYCANCIHNGDEENDPYCPVWAAHKDYNYRDCNDKSSILHILIPRSKDGLDNEQCTMFLRKAAVADLFEVAP
jgi:hypothetical protein